MTKKLTGKQRATLRSMANTIDATLHIGKGGVTENIVSQLNIELEARELIKCSILKTALLDTKETCSYLAEKTKSQTVQAIGSKFVLYRESVENKTIEL